jgi:D-lactate dehydrogenase (cytochrome)
MTADELERALVDLLGAEGVSRDEHELDAHGGRPEFGSEFGSRRPDVVAFARSAEQVSAVCEFASRTGVPIVPMGTGTAVGGATLPLHGGISLDLREMNQIHDISPADLTATVGAAVTRKALNRRLADDGLFFPVDPGADASLGGMAATNASGSRAMRYGAMRANVLALQAVLGDGSIVRTGTRASKSSAGYDLTRLLVGSEGTLGVITELTLRTYPIPAVVVSARAVFADNDAALRAVIGFRAQGLAVTRLEFLDGPTMAMVNDFRGTDYPAQATLFIEIGASEATAAGDIIAAQRIAEAEGAMRFELEREPDAQEQLWDARHQVGFAVQARAPEKEIIGTDVCVPSSELPGAIAFARAQLDERGMEASVIAHAGDGNYHLTFSIDRADSAELERFHGLYRELVAHALARGGTCSGEHGIGLAKIDFLEQEHGDLIPAMRAIKRGLDPAGILNPGKVIRVS